MGSKLLVVGVLITVLLVSLAPSCTCGLTETAPNQNRTKPVITYDNVELVLSTDKTTYVPGKVITITLTVTNKGSSSLKLAFPSAQQYDFVITMGGEEIWRWSHDKMFAAVLTEVTLAPSESVVYQEKWPQKDNQGKPVSPGRYQAIGVLKAHPESVSPSLIIEIVG